jgi:hypothetical protein
MHGRRFYDCWHPGLREMAEYPERPTNDGCELQAPPNTFAECVGAYPFQLNVTGCAPG